MKRFSVLFMAMFLVMFLAACGQSTKVYELKEDGMVSTVTIKHKDDEITEQISEDVMSYEMLGVSSKEEAEMFFGLMEQGVDSFPGIDFDVKYKKNELIQTVKIDYKKADLEGMFGLGSMLTGEDFGDITSVKEMVQMLKEQGYKEK